MEAPSTIRAYTIAANNTSIWLLFLYWSSANTKPNRSSKTRVKIIDGVVYLDILAGETVSARHEKGESKLGLIRTCADFCTEK